MEEWSELAYHVNAKLKEHDECVRGLQRDVSDLKIEIAMLKVKAGMWGLVGGLTPIAFAFLIWALKELTAHSTTPLP